MTIAASLLDTETLLGVFTHTEPLPNYWRSLAFGSTITSTDEYIDFEKIVKTRKMAPLVVPMAEGRPIFSEGSNLTRLKPAYIKVKDAVDPSRVIKKRVGSIFNRDQPTMEQRWDALVGDIMQEHRDTIERRWEWLAAKAVIDGKVVLSGEGYPTRLVDFGRDAGHTIVLAGAALWNGASANILGNLNSWRQLVRLAKFGGPTNRLTMGADAWEVFEKDPEVLAQLDTTVRGTHADIVTGLKEGGRVEYMGKIGTLELWVYADTYEENGVEVPFMSSKDVVLTGPNINGVAAYGAILDKGASFQPLPVYPKMWNQEDPSVTQIMNQSAPLFIPVNPNNSLKATVLV